MPPISAASTSAASPASSLSSAAAGPFIAERAPARLSIARRPMLDLQAAVPADANAAAVSAAADSIDTMGEPDPIDPIDDAALKLKLDSDFDLSSTFDIPAFLRRQDG